MAMVVLVIEKFVMVMDCGGTVVVAMAVRLEIYVDKINEKMGERDRRDESGL